MTRRDRCGRQDRRRRPLRLVDGEGESSLAFFDGVLSGISNGHSYYLKEDLIFEILEHLRDREPTFRKYFAWSSVFEDYGYPFGHRVDLGKAAKSCALLGDA